MTLTGRRQEVSWAVLFFWGDGPIRCPECDQDLSGYDTEVLAAGKCPECGARMIGDSDDGSGSGSRPSIAESTVQELLGKTVGNCEVLEVLGSGGMGVVFKAHHLALDKIVALKVLPGALASSGAGHIERFLVEARAAARIEHPNLVQVYDINEDQGYYYIIMQYVDGTDLWRLVADRGPMDADLALTIVQQVALALHEVHKAGVIHRDIKPTNVMLSRSGQAKLMDLGLAKMVTGGDSGISDANMVLGTPDYMAPEQAVKGGAGVEERSDIYSLGATFYHLLTGRPPFEGDTAVAIMVKHATEAVISPGMLNPKVPTQVSRLIEKMLSKSPDDRHESASDLLYDLQRVESEVAQGPSGVEPYNFSRSCLRQTAYIAATALQRELVGADDVLEALRVQRDLVAFGARRSLPEVLVEKSYITTRNLDALLDDYRKRERERLNTLFGKVAVSSGFVDRETMKRALAEQGRQLLAGSEVLIGKLLMDEGVLKTRQIREILRRQGEIQRSADESFFEKEAISRGVAREEVNRCIRELESSDPADDKTLVRMLLEDDQISAETAHEMVAAQIRQLVEGLSADRAVPEGRPSESGVIGKKIAGKAIIVDDDPLPGAIDRDRVPPIGEAAVAEVFDSGLEQLVDCPKCQAEVSEDAPSCPECGCILKEDASAPIPAPAPAPPPPPAPVQAAPPKEPPKSKVLRPGEWGYLSGDSATDQGVTHEEMVRLIAEGKIDDDTTVRGPGTGGQWIFAGRAPGIAKHLSVCPHCEKPVSSNDQICVWCDRFLDLPDTTANLPKVGEGKVAQLKRWLHRNR